MQKVIEKYSDNFPHSTQVTSTTLNVIQDIKTGFVPFSQVLASQGSVGFLSSLPHLVEKMDRLDFGLEGHRVLHRATLQLDHVRRLLAQARRAPVSWGKAGFRRLAVNDVDLGVEDSPKLLATSVEVVARHMVRERCCRAIVVRWLGRRIDGRSRCVEGRRRADARPHGEPERDEAEGQQEDRWPNKVGHQFELGIRAAGRDGGWPQSWTPETERNSATEPPI